MWIRAAAAVLSFTGLASGYYHYVHFTTTGAPWFAAPEKFDLNALPNRTVQFFIHEPAGLQLAATDSLTSVVSHVRAGARVWNDVATSELRIAFGGIVPPGTHFTSPVIEVLFDEMPPGTLAYGGPRVLAETNGSFVPIVTSQVVLDRDVSKRPSYTEEFFATLVHEFGHALGLQHTLTSSAMSTRVTRSVTKSRPLGTDDVAGLSVLYPSRQFAATTGVIAGRVGLGAQGVNLASVVAVSANGPAISALTNPDGTYRIEGVPPGQYVVYVHALPPRVSEQNEVSPANITYPVGADNRAIPEGPVFDTQFFPGVRDPQQALLVPVTAGSAADNINFTVRTRGPLQIYSVETWGFVSQVALKPPYLSPASVYPFVIARGPGLLSGQSVAPGLTASVIGGPALGLKPYSAPGFLQADVDVRSVMASGEGARHVVFTSPNDTYVLPAAFRVAANQPPSITGVGSGSDGGARAAVISGAGLSDQTRILFDGVPALRQSFDEAGRLVAVAPPARGGHRATVVALNPDGQSSLFVSAAPAVYAYEGDPGAPMIWFTPNTLPAGVDAMVTIEAAGATFVDGAVTVAFGSPDITVRRVWVVNSPSARLIASVSIAPRALSAPTTVTVTTGLQTITQPFSFQVAPANPRALVLSGQVSNAVAGGVATTSVVSAPMPLVNAPVQLFLNDRPVAVNVTLDNQVSFPIPATTPPGLATLRLQVGSDTSLPIAFAVEAAPLQITSVMTAGQPFDSTRGIAAAELVAVLVTGFGDPNTTIAPGRVTVSLGSMQFAPSQVLVATGAHAVIFTAPAGAGTGAVPLTISIDGRTSPAFTVTLR